MKRIWITLGLLLAGLLVALGFPTAASAQTGGNLNCNPSSINVDTCMSTQWYHDPAWRDTLVRLDRVTVCLQGDVGTLETKSAVVQRPTLQRADGTTFWTGSAFYLYKDGPRCKSQYPDVAANSFWTVSAGYHLYNNNGPDKDGVIRASVD